MFHGSGVDAGVAGDGGAAADASDGAVECPTLGGYRTCGSLCEARCDPSEGCRQYFDICVPFSEVTGCSVTLSSNDAEYPERMWCLNGGTCVVSSVALMGAGIVGGLCVREDYCRDVRMTTVDGRCMWSDESEYVDGPPEVSSCPSTPNDRVPFCGGPCGSCDTSSWLGYYSPRASCAGVSDRRGFGVCTFDGRQPCSRGIPGATEYCTTAERWGEPCACMVLELPDGSFQEIGFPTLASSCLEYLRHYPDTVRCMDPFEWVPLEP